MKFKSGIQQEKSGQFLLEHNERTGAFTFMIREIRNSEGFITKQKRIGIIPRVLVSEAEDPKALADLVQNFADQIRSEADKVDDRECKDIDEIAKTYDNSPE